jgi:hypothetical protein
MVGQRDVYGIDVWLGQQLSVRSIGSLDAKCSRNRLCLL